MNRKTVAYITRHIVSNYGSVLQAYATQEALKKLGCRPVCIDYLRTDEKPKNLVATRLSASEWNTNPIKKAVYMLTQKPVYALADKRFARYRQILDVTQREYNTVEALEQDCPQADVYLTGSDQVWNTVVCGVLDPAYFLSFVPDDRRKVAYAASFGGVLTEEQRAFAAPLIRRYDSVSVREDSGLKQLREMGVDAEQVLDPTFLLDKTAWEQLIPNRTCRQPYVLVYQLHPNKQFDKYAKAFAKRKGLKLIRVSSCFHHAVRSGKFVCCPPPGDFLWYIRNASYFLTDSFHGTAFAIGLNTQFVDILPKAYSERISSILTLIGCENRVLRDYSDFSIADEPIDYERVNAVIAKERQKSLDILRTMLGD